MALTERHISSAGTDTWVNSTNIATPCSWATMSANLTAGDRANVKADGTYTLGASDTITGPGTTTSPAIIRGYKDALGDGFQGRTGGNGALITTHMPVIAYDATFKLTVPAFTLLESLNMSAAINGSTVSLTSPGAIKSCKITNSSIGAAAAAIIITNSSIVFDCDLELTGASGGLAAVSSTTQTSVRILCCRIKGGPAVGITFSTGTPIIFGNVIFASATNHIKATNAAATPTILYNTLVGATGTGILMTTGSTSLSAIIGNMITDIGAYGLDWVSAAGAAVTGYNRWRDTTSGDVNLGTDWRTATAYADVTTDTGGPETDYTNSGTDDYTLISASPAKAVGWPKYLDIGALQRQESAGGAARRFVQNL